MDRSNHTNKTKPGLVCLVGAGPGDPGLITVRGQELLKVCDAVVYDHLASDWFLSLLKPDCRRIYAGKQAGHHSMSQEEINRVLGELALEGLMVVRLKGGDPFVFGRGGEEILYLKSLHIPWELVPGVTSAVAVPELSGIPVTHRGVSRSFHVITGHTRTGTREETVQLIRSCAGLSGTLVFLMGLNQLGLIARQLIDAGMDPHTPSAVIENGSLPGQRALRAPLKKLEEEAKKAVISTPAIIVVGETADLDLHCPAKKPLSGLSAGITGTDSFRSRLRLSLEREGALVWDVLKLELDSYVQSPAMKDAYQQLSACTWLLFTSANGVELFIQGLLDQGLDLRALGHMKLAVIGQGTADALLKHGLRADHVPSVYCASALAESLIPRLTAADRLLIPRAKEGSRDLNRILSDHGIAYEDVPLYSLRSGGFLPHPPLDCLIFASSSGVRAYFENREPDPGTALVCIGEKTAQTLSAYGRKADRTASSYDIEGIIKALTEDGGFTKEDSL